MKVWCVFSGSHEDRALAGVYGTLEGAQAAPHNGGSHPGQWSDPADDPAGDGSYWRCQWEIHHHRARVPVGITLEQREIPVVNGVAALSNGRTVTVGEGDRLIVPVLPEGANIGPVTDWSDRCDYEIEEHDVIQTG